jgi:uncharacterized protein YjbI with pentapeptide repeats
MCIGVCVGGESQCLAHVQAPVADRVIVDMKPGDDIDLRGVVINAGLFNRILDACVVDKKGYPRFKTGRFNNATFASAANFRHASFLSDADFSNARFKDDVSFNSVRFQGGTKFDGAVFAGRFSFRGAERGRRISFVGALFEQPGDLGPMHADVLDLSQARFAATVNIETAPRSPDAASEIRARDTIFEAEASIVTNAEVTLSGASIAAALLTVQTRDGGSPAAVRSLARVDASRLVLVEVDLSRCELTGSRQLDQLRMDGRSTFAESPRLGKAVRLRKDSWAGIRAARSKIYLPYSRRQVLAEEFNWRVQRGAWVGERYKALEPERVAALYRQLRKAFEDAKNEPGAADFYYGEMEMRRQAKSTSFGERFIEPFRATG